jgi:hypothetical protein
MRTKQFWNINLSTRVLIGEVHVIISNVLRSTVLLEQPVQDISVTYDQGYVPFVVVTIASSLEDLSPRIFNNSNMTATTSVPNSAYHSGVLEFAPRFKLSSSGS